jgi:hypothetical protein
MTDGVNPSVQRATTRIHRPAACYVVGVVLILFMLFAGALIVAVHLNAVEWLSRTSLLRTHVMCAAFGMLGAAMAGVRKYYKTLITETTARMGTLPSGPVVWDLGWLVYYLTRPILGAILGALSFTLSFVGFHVLANPSKIEISDEGRYLLFALAFVAGFAVSQVLDRLNSVAKEIFKASSEKEGG